MFSKRCSLIFFTLLFLFLLSEETSASKYQRVEGVIHLDTNIGGGTSSPEEIVKRVRDAGLKVAVITDHDNMRVEYGFPFLRNIIKKRVDRGGIREYGSKRYIETIDSLKPMYPALLLLHGTEAIPFYYWEGSPIKGDLVLNNWHKHILILGLKDSEDYDNIPSVGFGYPRRIGFSCIKNLWPLALFISGFILLRKKGEVPHKIGKFTIKQKKKPYLITGILLIIIPAVFLFNNFPFCEPIFDQYHGDKGKEPYQYLIDYADKKGALTFWAHPEVESLHKEKAPLGKGLVKIHTPAYYNDLLETNGYTGFAVFQEGYKILGMPGGLWDKILKEYCEGKRERPVWAIGELDYKEGEWMGETQTVFLLRDFNESGVLDALKTGRVYAVRGKDKPVLEDFSLKGSQGEAIMGEELLSKEPVEVSIKLRFPYAHKKEAKVYLIRNGDILETFSTKTDFLIKYKDDYFRPGEMIYYRLTVGEQLITNPIFVRFGE